MSPWPAQTEYPLAGPLLTAAIPSPTSSTHAHRAPRRRRAPSGRHAHHAGEVLSDNFLPRDMSPNIYVPRQVIGDQDAVDEAIQECEVLVGNGRYSCFPTADTVILQGQWASFVWNSKRPELTQDNKVNLYLYRADSRTQIHSAEDLDNDPLQHGVYRVQADDSWWGEEGANFNEGQNTTYPFYWVITPASRGLDGSERTQTIFSAIQTTYPNSVLATMSPSSSTASTSDGSSDGSTVASSTATPSSANDASNTGSMSAGAASDDFPRWAIAVIVVLGFLAIAALCVLTFIILRRSRNRRQFDSSNRNSMGSSSPMMANAATASVGSPLLPPAAFHGPDPSKEESEERHPTSSLHDGASVTSRANSQGDGPFSGADAAIMADAFRKALRKPDFVDRTVDEAGGPSDKDRDERLINRELAEEGRDIRSVASSRGVKVETVSNEGD